MSVDPGDGWRLLVDGEVMPEKKEFLHDDGKWVETRGWTGVTFDSKQFRPCRVKITVTTSGPCVAIEVHRAALAEIERLKAELEAVKQPQQEPEPEWFDLTPFGEHVLRRDVDWVVYTDSEKWEIVGISRGAKIGQVRGYIAKARCLLKDAPPELVAMASKPEWPKYYTTDDLSGSRIAYIIRCSQTQYQMMTTNGTISENVFLWNKFDDETRTEITKEKADAILAEKRPKPAEDPDEWVTQDRVPYRKEFDQCKWDSFDEWLSFQDLYPHYRHGFRGVSGEALQVRCRRRDLPPMPEQKPKTEREVLLYWYDGNVVGRYADCPPTDPSFVPLIVRDGKVFIETETREVVR